MAIQPIKSYDINITKILSLLFQSDEDKDNYDEVHCTIEQSIMKERLSRLARLGFPEHLPQSAEAAADLEEQAGAIKERLSCDAIHKRFNLTTCSLCKQGNGSDKREERKKRNLAYCSFITV